MKQCEDSVRRTKMAARVNLNSCVGLSGSHTLDTLFVDLSALHYAIG